MRVSLDLCVRSVLCFAVLLLGMSWTAYAGDEEAYAIEIQRYLFSHHAEPAIDVAPVEQTDGDQAGVVEEAAPKIDLNEIRFRSLRSYFADELANGTDVELKKESLDKLLADAEAVFVASRPEDAAAFVTFREQTLEPAIRRMKADALFKKPLFGGPRLGDWSVADLVLRQQVRHIGRLPNAFNKTIDLLKRARTMNTRYRAGFILSLAGATYLVTNVHDWKSLAVVAYLVFQEPIRDLSGAMTGFFRRPMNEVLKVAEYRVTGDLERDINNFADRLMRRFRPQSTDDNVNRTVLPANVANDGMSFGRMTEADQSENYDWVRQVWVEIAKYYGQLNRDTHHWGRQLQMIIWNDQMQGAQIVNIMLEARGRAAQGQDDVLAPYQTALVVRGGQEAMAAKDQMTRAMQTIRDEHDALWKDPYASEAIVAEHTNRINRAERELRELGVTQVDLQRIGTFEKERRQATMVLVMGLATDEARLFGMAEANRNLPPGHARLGAAEVRRGFNLQQHIDDWWVVVATIHRRIGYRKNATLDQHIANSRAAVCEATFASGN